MEFEPSAGDAANEASCTVPPSVANLEASSRASFLEEWNEFFVAVVLAVLV